MSTPPTISPAAQAFVADAIEMIEEDHRRPVPRSPDEARADFARLFDTHLARGIAMHDAEKDFANFPTTPPLPPGP